MHVYQKFPCTIDSIRNWPNKKVHENWMQLAVKILWLIKNNQGLLKYSLHGLNLQVYFSKIFQSFQYFFRKKATNLRSKEWLKHKCAFQQQQKWRHEPWILSRNSVVKLETNDKRSNPDTKPQSFLISRFFFIFMSHDHLKIKIEVNYLCLNSDQIIEYKILVQIIKKSLSWLTFRFFWLYHLMIRCACVFWHLTTL